MRFEQTKLKEVLIVHQEVMSDNRGFFSRVYCEQTFNKTGLNFTAKQINRSLSLNKFTLRGLHYQINDSAEEKFIRVIKGSIWDVAVDVRPESPTYLRYVGVNLDAVSSHGIFIPKGFAHGMLTMSDDTEIEYIVSSSYSPANERGLRWNDPSLGITWPQEPKYMSEKDSTWKFL
jgi:dTDP-4-dehydrorhamnose 3,5-epimerase